MAHPGSAKGPRAKVARASGRTLEIAVSRALAELDFAPGELSDEQYRVTILIPPEDGFMGVGGVDAQVEVELTDEDLLEPEMESVAGAEPAMEDYVPPAGSTRLREYLSTLLSHLGVEAEIHIVEDADSITADIAGEDLGVVIGKRGQTIDAIEYLASIILYPNPDVRKRLEIDAEGYKQRRKRTIESIALRKAQEASKRGKPVRLEPMSAAERKIVHLALKERRDVATESTGREPYRAVVISPIR